MYLTTEPPSTCNITSQGRRESTIRTAVERIEKSVSELDSLVAQVQSEFGPVIYHRPTAGEAVQEKDSIPGSDLGQALTRLADRLERSNRAIRVLVEQADT